MNWLIHVHESFMYSSPSLFLCIDILDAYLSKVRFPKNRLQLLGVAALFTAGKIEEIYPEMLEKYCEITNYTFSKDEILFVNQSIH